MDTPETTQKASSKPFASAFNLFTPSIEVIKRNVTSFVLFLIVPMVLTSVGGLINEFTGNTDPMAPFTGLSGTLLALGGVITLLTVPALTLVELKGARAESIEPDDAFSFGLRRVLRLFGLFVLMSLILIGSFLLLVVPFFFMLRRYYLAPYYLIDQDMGIMAALKASAADSKQFSKPIWGLIGVTVLIGFISIVPLLGSIASAIASVLYAAAPAVRYEQIKAAKAGKAPVAPIEKTIPTTT